MRINHGSLIYKWIDCRNVFLFNSQSVKNTKQLKEKMPHELTSIVALVMFVWYLPFILHSSPASQVYKEQLHETRCKQLLIDKFFRK